MWNISVCKCSSAGWYDKRWHRFAWVDCHPRIPSTVVSSIWRTFPSSCWILTLQFGRQMYLAISDSDKSEILDVVHFCGNQKLMRYIFTIRLVGIRAGFRWIGQFSETAHSDKAKYICISYAYITSMDNAVTEYLRSEPDTCWICLTSDSEGSLVNPCRCPGKRVHAACMARWQLQKAGTRYDLRQEQWWSLWLRSLSSNEWVLLGCPGQCPYRSLAGLAEIREICEYYFCSLQLKWLGRYVKHVCP